MSPQLTLTLPLSGRTKVKLTVGVRSQESARIARITFLKTDERIYVRLLI
ncbi:hypothetical protein [Microcystis sp. M53602_WE12]|nr:hypothetical protein [Microcystis sp. M53602_WE12]